MALLRACPWRLPLSTLTTPTRSSRQASRFARGELHSPPGPSSSWCAALPPLHCTRDLRPRLVALRRIRGASICGELVTPRRGACGGCDRAPTHDRLLVFAPCPVRAGRGHVRGVALHHHLRLPLALPFRTVHDRRRQPPRARPGHSRSARAAAAITPLRPRVQPRPVLCAAGAYALSSRPCGHYGALPPRCQRARLGLGRLDVPHSLARSSDPSPAGAPRAPRWAPQPYPNRVD